MIVLDSTYFGLGAEMAWFVITTILVVLIIGGGMVIAFKSYEPHRRR